MVVYRTICMALITGSHVGQRAPPAPYWSEGATGATNSPSPPTIVWFDYGSCYVHRKRLVLSVFISCSVQTDLTKRSSFSSLEPNLRLTIHLVCSPFIGRIPTCASMKTVELSFKLKKEKHLAILLLINHCRPVLSCFALCHSFFLSHSLSLFFFSTPFLSLSLSLFSFSFSLSFPFSLSLSHTYTHTYTRTQTHTHKYTPRHTQAHTTTYTHTNTHKQTRHTYTYKPNSYSFWVPSIQSFVC